MRPTVLLLPGLAADAAMWAAQRDVLAASHAPHVADVHFRFVTLPEMAHALLAENAGELVPCGASMGGILAFEVLRQAPARVRGVALLGTTARPDSPEIAALRASAFAMIQAGRYDVLVLGGLAVIGAFARRRASCSLRVCCGVGERRQGLIGECRGKVGRAVRRAPRHRLQSWPSLPAHVTGRFV